MNKKRMMQAATTQPNNSPFIMVLLIFDINFILNEFRVNGFGD